jgi:hypothetical protein
MKKTRRKKSRDTVFLRDLLLKTNSEGDQKKKFYLAVFARDPVEHVSCCFSKAVRSPAQIGGIRNG